MRLFIALLLVSFNALALDWYDLELSKEYTLKQSFELPQTERSGSLLHFEKGEKYLLEQAIPLDMINVIYLQFKALTCPGPAMATEMEIIPVQSTTPVVEIGAQLQLDCKLEVFIETKDFITPSFFE